MSKPWLRCSRPSTPMMIGVSRPSRDRMGPSPMPRNLPTVDANRPDMPPPSSDDNKLVPLSAICAGPLRLLAMLPSRSVGCSATAFPSCRAPPGLPATSANPLRIAGTAAAVALCAMDRSSPVAEAILPISSGVKKREIVDTMLSVMAAFPSRIEAGRSSCNRTHVASCRCCLQKGETTAAFACAGCAKRSLRPPGLEHTQAFSADSAQNDLSISARA